MASPAAPHQAAFRRRSSPGGLDLAVVGAGYVGLVTAACLAERGHRVAVVEKDGGRLGELLAGRMPIHEPGLAELARSNVDRGRLRFAAEIRDAVAGAEAVFLAVGTPPRPDDGGADLTQVYEASFALAPWLKNGAVVIVKSTVPVGTGDEVEEILRKLRPAAGIAVVSNPEFLRAGAAIDDFMRPDRIVVGTSEHGARAVMSAIYGTDANGNSPPLVFTDRRSAELTKYAANAFLAMKVTFINEIADLCEAVGADVQDIARGIGLDRRIGPDFLRPGPGLGGSCFPKDTVALVRDGRRHGVTLGVVAAVASANGRRRAAMAKRILAAIGEPVAGSTIAFLGLTFKAETDDMREAPSLAIVPALQAAGASVRAYDPKGMDAARPLLPGVAFAVDPYACAEGADAVVIATEWAEFRSLDLSRLKASMARPLVIDLRNIYPPEVMSAAGLEYHSIGRPVARPAPELPAKLSTRRHAAATQDAAIGSVAVAAARSA